MNREWQNDDIVLTSSNHATNFKDFISPPRSPQLKTEKEKESGRKSQVTDQNMLSFQHFHKKYRRGIYSWPGAAPSWGKPFPQWRVEKDSRTPSFRAI